MSQARHQNRFLERLRLWLRELLGLAGRDQPGPQEAYERVIRERTLQYDELKRAVAGILFLHQRLRAEIGERRAEIARLHDEARDAARRGRDELTLALIARKQELHEELGRVKAEVETAKASLTSFRHEIRELVHEKGRMLAMLQTVRVRRHLNRALEGLSVDSEMAQLDEVRDWIGKLHAESELERELAADRTLGQLGELRDAARQEAARRELEAIKREMAEQALAQAG